MRRLALLSFLLAPSIAAANQPAVGENVRLSEVNNTVVESVDTFGLISHSDSYQSPASSLETVSVGRAAAKDESGWFGDLGFYILNPTWTGGNTAFSTVSPIDGVSTSTQVVFDHGSEFVPFFQIGYAGRNGLGIRGRWWTVDSSDTQSFSGEINGANGVRGPSLLGAGAGFVGVDPLLTESTADFVASNQLRMDVIDLEGIWSIDYVRSSVLLSAGVRYAHVSQSYNAELNQEFDPIIGPNFFRSNSLDSFHSFNGVGPTVSAQLNRGIGDTNLSVYGLSRGSLLVGEHRHSAFGDYAILADQAGVNNSDGVLPVMELEVGGSWVRPMRSFDLFIEGGFVAMTWFNAGNAANTNAIVGDGVGSYDANQNMHLTGLRFSGGVKF